MYELKTKPTKVSVTDFINTHTDERVRKDSFEILEMMRDVTKEEPYMWGSSIIGFGTYHYKYSTGHEGDCPKLAFSPRKNQFSIYLSCDSDKNADLMSKLGKYKSGKSCLYIKRLDDVDKNILRKLFINTLKQLK